MQKEGFVIVIVVVFLAVLVLIATTMLSVGLSELMQAKTRNDFDRAYYLAISGAQMQYLTYTETGVEDLSEQEVVLDTVGGTQIKGYFDPITYPIAGTKEVRIKSVGYVNKGTASQRNVTIIAKYFRVPSISAAGQITLQGRSFIVTSRVYVNESIGSNTGINPIRYVSLPEYRKVPNPQLPNLYHPTTHDPCVIYTDPTQEEAHVKLHAYWITAEKDADGNPIPKLIYDTNNDGHRITDYTGDAIVTIPDAVEMAKTDPDYALDPVATEERYKNYFRADNVYHPEGTSEAGPVDDKDAFYQYYTGDLDTKYDLDIGTGESGYYSSGQTFAFNIPQDKSILFVDGDVDIWFSAQHWGGGACDLTIVSMEDISIYWPLNGSDDRLTLISYNSFYTGYSLNLGNVNGDLVVQAGGTLTMEYGGTSNGALYTSNAMNVDTKIISALFNRVLNKERFDMKDPSKVPVGLHPYYPKSGAPKWQRP